MVITNGVLNNVDLLNVILQNVILPNVTLLSEVLVIIILPGGKSVECGSAHCHSAENHLWRTSWHHTEIVYHFEKENIFQCSILNVACFFF